MAALANLGAEHLTLSQSKILHWRCLRRHLQCRVALSEQRPVACSLADLGLHHWREGCCLGELLDVHVAYFLQESFEAFRVQKIARTFWASFGLVQILVSTREVDRGLLALILHLVQLLLGTRGLHKALRPALDRLDVGQRLLVLQFGQVVQRLALELCFSVCFD